jgi:hypothetical protein
VDDMREIVTVEQIDRLFLLLAIAGPVLGAIAGSLFGARQGGSVRGAGIGLAIGLLGPVNLGLWTLYNRVTDHLGLDTVRNLLVNLAIFAALGVAAGVLVAYLRRGRSAA